LITFKLSEAAHVGVEFEDYVVDLTAAGIVKTMLELARMGDAGLAAAKAVIDGGEFRQAKPVVLLAPIGCQLQRPEGLPEKVLNIGMNYVDHCTEQDMPVPTEPLIFNKFPSTICGPDDNINKDPETEELDFEVELAVVIGKTVPRRSKTEDCSQYILGYTVAHDVSARDWQLKKNGGQWLLGKTFDTYAPLGPAIVTRDEVDVKAAKLWCKVNGEQLQTGNTDQLVFTCEECIAWISRFVTLYPGDVIMTGTPPGVGCFRKPPVWLKGGEEVICGIEGIGEITNKVVAVEV